MIIYTLIAKGSLVLIEYTEADGDFPILVRKILVSLKKSDEKQLYSKDEYIFCIYPFNEYKFIAMIHANASKEKAFHFLNALKDEYIKEYQDPSFSNMKFTQKVAILMKGFNKLDERDALSNLEDTVEDLQESASQNLRQMIEREVKLDVLVEKTQQLTQNADLVYHQSRRIKDSLGKGSFRIGGKLFLFAVNLVIAVSIYIYLRL